MLTISRILSLVILFASLLLCFKASAQTQHIPLPTPIVLPSVSPSVSPNTLMPSPTPETTAPPIDNNGRFQWIYEEGQTNTMLCALRSACTIFFRSGESITKVLGDASGWTVTIGKNSVKPYVSFVPNTYTPPVGITVVTSQNRHYGLILFINSAAINRMYRYQYPDSHRVVHIALKPIVRVAIQPPPESLASVENINSPIAPEPCPKSYSFSRQGKPPFWPHEIKIQRETIALWFPSYGEIPNVGVPTSNTPPGQVWLDHLANIPDADGVDGKYRILRILTCYHTIVLYTGFGKSRSAIILTANSL